MKRTPLPPRAKPMARRTRPKARGRRRFPKGADPAYLDWVRTLPCAVAGPGCLGVVVAHHAKSKGAGGTDRMTVPLCDFHHRLGHDQGWRTFGHVYEIDLPAVAAQLSRRYDEEAR